MASEVQGTERESFRDGRGLGRQEGGGFSCVFFKGHNKDREAKIVFFDSGEKVGALTTQAGCGMGLLPREALTERLGSQAPLAGSN